MKDSNPDVAFLTLWSVCGTWPVLHYRLYIRMVPDYYKRGKVSPQHVGAVLSKRGGSDGLLSALLLLLLAVSFRRLPGNLPSPNTSEQIEPINDDRGGNMRHVSSL